MLHILLALFLHGHARPAVHHPVAKPHVTHLAPGLPASGAILGPLGPGTLPTHGAPIRGTQPPPPA